MLKVTNFKIILFVLLFIFLVDIRCIYGIHTVGDEEYEILLKLAKGTFSFPVKERNQVQKSAIVKFWRAKGITFLEGQACIIDSSRSIRID